MLLRYFYAMFLLYDLAGNSNINLLRLDPLEVPHILIEQGEESPVNVVLKFANNTVIGLDKVEIYKIK